MDRKTLNYLENKTRKAREIVNTIDKLKENLELLREMDRVVLMKGGRAWIYSVDGDLTLRLKGAYEEIAKQRIDELEKELEQL